MPIAHGSRITLLALALSAMLGSTSAGAVHISPSGTGQVLIFPYYTVRNGFNTLINIANTQGNAKIVKVRFRESLNGREVLNFNLFLAPNDSWAGAVIATSQGARVVTNDNSCVAPSDLFKESRPPIDGRAINEFNTFFYTGSNADSPTLGSLDRTREGYLEVIEMGVVDPALSSRAGDVAAYMDINNSRYNCAELDKYDPGLAQPVQFPNQGAAMMVPPRGGLSGRVSLINAATGANYSFGPTALDGFSSQIVYAPAGLPTGAVLTDANPATSVVTTPAGVVIAQWTNGRDAVSAVMMRDAVINEFVIDEGTASQTDWVLTMPTRAYYTDSRYIPVGLQRTPFFADSSASAIACEPYIPGAVDRDGKSRIPNNICPATDLPPPAGSNGLCQAAGVIPLASRTSIATGINSAAGLLGTAQPGVTAGSCSRPGLESAISDAKTVAGAVATPALRGEQGPNGTITLKLSGTTVFPVSSRAPLVPVSAKLVSSTGAVSDIPGLHYGLPVIGLMLHNYKNANVTSRYGGVIEHTYSVRIE